ncbi:large neutral amino acids transporter small subunit 4-like [Hyperolius riggenbachi]|uniref:large neutral amino acids transporter small subunit 4-like n=1 Tax=Hyperolius riggenbachi TaxID=752182 RepID=UPI0035A33874
MGRRLWVLGSALLETLLFSGCLLGWNSLSPILMELGVLAQDCYSDAGLPEERSNNTTPLYDGNDTAGDWLSPPPTVAASSPAPPQDLCPSQEKYLNLGFTVGSFFLWGSFLPLQLLLGYAYIRSLRQIGGALVSVSCLMLAYCCTNPPSLSLFLPFALVALGVGGGCVMFSSLMLPYILPDVTPIYPSLVIGCFTASATVFTIIKVIYNAGVPFVPILLGYGAISCAMFLNSFFCWNLEKKTVDEENLYRVHLRLNCYNAVRKEPQEKEWCQVSLRHKFRASLRDRERILSQRRALSFKKPEASVVPPLQESLMTPTFILHLLADSILITWMYFYISTLNLHLRKLTDVRHQADLYSSVFGALQMLSLLLAPFIGILLNNYSCLKIPRKDEANKTRVTHKRLCSGKRLGVVYGLRILLMCCFAVTSLISSLQVQVLAFILHIIVRTSMFMVNTTLYQCMFHKDHFGSLLGIHTIISSLLTTLQHPLYLLLIGPLQGDPFWIHSVFLALSLGSAVVPVCLMVRRSKHHHRFSRPTHLRLGAHPAKTPA